ncbi:MAG: hypothetical protein ACRD0G_20015 [Acidimicrobiales bacterium]
MRVVGCSVGTGWAVLVTIDETPTVVDRRRVELVAGDARFAYHAAAELPLPEAEALVDHTAAVARREADRAVADLGPLDLDASAIVTAVPRAPRPLAEVLASHASIHAAEGGLYRHALAEAFGAAAVKLVTVARQDVRATDLDLASLGRQVGPPWRKEHKEAAAAAWLVLAGR